MTVMTEEKTKDWSETRSLIRGTIDGNEKAFESLLIRWKGYIENFTRVWLGGRNSAVLPYEDAVMAATEGFWQSTLKFSLEKGKDFLSFVRYGMADSLKKSLSSAWSERGVTGTMRSLWKRVVEAEDNLYSEGIEATDSEIAAFLGDVTAEEVGSVRNVWKLALPESADFLTATVGDSWHVAAEDSEIRLAPENPVHAYRKAVSKLTEEEQLFISMLEEGLTRAEIAEALSMTVRTVSNWKDRLRAEIEEAMGIAA